MESLGLSVFDCIGIVLVLVFFIIGCKKGFLKEISGLINCVISFIGAKTLSYGLGEKLYAQLGLHDKLQAEVVGIVDKADFTSLHTLRASLSVGLEKLSYVGKVIEDFISNKWDITAIYQENAENIKEKISEVIMESVQPAVKYIAEILAFVLMLIVLLIVTSICLRFLIKVFEKIPLVGTANALLGGVIGAVKGVIIFAVVVSICFVIFSMKDSELLITLKESKFFDLIIGLKNVLPTA